VPVFSAPDFFKHWSTFGSEVADTLTGTTLTAIEGDPKYSNLGFKSAHEAGVDEAISKIKDQFEQVAAKCFQREFISLPKACLIRLVDVFAT